MKFALVLFAANLICSIGGIAMSIALTDKSIGLNMAIWGVIFCYAGSVVLSFNKPAWDGLADIIYQIKVQNEWKFILGLK